MDGAKVAVWFPKDRGYLPQAAIEAAAQKLAGLSTNLLSEHLVQLKGYSGDGCAVFELLQVR